MRAEVGQSLGRSGRELSALSLGQGAGGGAGGDGANTNISPAAWPPCRSPVADVRTILVRPLCDAGRGEAWLEALRLPRGRWLRGSGGRWSGRPGRGGVTVGRGWVGCGWPSGEIACRGAGGGSGEGSPRAQPGCQLLYLEPWRPGRPVPYGQPTQVRGPHLQPQQTPPHTTIARGTSVSSPQSVR